MFRSRAVQYAGLALLMLACLAIIFYPVGATPERRGYTVSLTAPKPFQQLAGAGKLVNDVADQALLQQFKSGERLPPGSLTVLADGRTATLEDEATTRPEAQARARRIVQALQKPFPGTTSTLQTDQDIADLPAQPLFSLGKYAVFPFQRDTAIKLGLDLRGGVNLVLQVRRALFTYNFDKKLGSDPDARDQFATQVRNALAQAPADVNLNEADVNLAPGQATVLEVRTQAKDRAEFEAQRQAILQVLSSGVPGVKFTETREPQFFQPDEAVGQGMGLTDNYSAELLNRTVEIVRSRVDRLGVSEPQIQAQPPDRIAVQLPGINDPQRAIDVVGTTAQMEIRLLPVDLLPVPDPADPNNTLIRDKAGAGNVVPSNVARERSELIVSGRDVKPTTTVGFTDGNEAAIFFELQGEGARKFAEVTRRVQNPNQVPGKDRYIPIFLDERIISAPRVESAITGGSGQISGGFKNVEEARELALLLNSGALPAPIDVVENRTVSATLGTDSLVKSLRAGLIGLILVAIFMIAFYRLPGMLANFALIVYCVLNLAVFILIGGTLTLPGIAGFLLAIAMSLDTNILVFERLKEEMRIQPTFAAALRAAFSRAWTAILDSHVTTLCAALVLFYFGTGPIKGFALTLGIGVLLSLFSAISVTRLFMWSVARWGEGSRTLFGSGISGSRELAPESK